MKSHARVCRWSLLAPFWAPTGKMWARGRWRRVHPTMWSTGSTERVQLSLLSSSCLKSSSWFVWAPAGIPTLCCERDSPPLPHVSAFFLFFFSLSAGSQRSHSPFPKPQMAYSLKKLITNWVRLILNKGRHTWREAGVTDRPETSLLESLCFSVFSKRPSCLAAFIT